MFEAKLRCKRYYRVCRSDFFHDQNILFALEENAIHRHRQKEEATPHLHTGYNKSKLEQLHSAGLIHGDQMITIGFNQD
jgi:hypothetical protein